jgi:outer membrane lipoprotein-sorting protein
MNCETALNHLDALADGELGAVGAFFVKRHLSRCGSCAEAFEETVRLSESARSWRTALPSEAWSEGLRRSANDPDFAAVLMRAKEPHPAVADELAGGIFAPDPPLRADRRWLRWGPALAVVAFLLVAICVNLRPVSAFAQLQRAANAFNRLNSAHLVGWHLIGPEGKKITLEAWFAQPNRSWMKDGDRLETCDGEFVWRYRDGSSFVRRQPLSERDAAASWKKMFDPDEQVRWIGAHPEQLHDLGVQRTNAGSLRVLRLTGPTLDERETWWVDPKTNLIRRFVQERQAEDGKSWRAKMEIVSIDYDEEPPAKRFSFAPPPGVKTIQLRPGFAGSFSNRICDGRVLATRTDLSRDHWSMEGGGRLELTAFTRSEGGVVFAAARGDRLGGYPDDAVKFVLTDSDGGRYAEAALGSDPQSGYVRAFFPLQPTAKRGALVYRLRYLRIPEGGTRDPYDEDAGRYRLAAEFDALAPTPPPPGLDDLLEEFVEDEQGLSLEYVRSVKTGLLAYREKRFREALSPLKTAVSLAKTGWGYEDAGPAFLALADLCLRQGRRADADRILEKFRRMIGQSDPKALRRMAAILQRRSEEPVRPER